MRTNNIQFRLAAIIFAVSGAFTTMQVKAQLSPLGAMYFQNQYLGNPAMAGADKGLHLDLAYRKQWSVVTGAPTTQSGSLNYGSGKRVGLGVNVLNDEAGLLKRTRVMGTYAYHLPVGSEDQKLSFGVSLGFMDERVMSEKINGDMNDPSVGKFNQRETYLDGDFGAAYRGRRLTVQGAIPNLKSFFGSDEAEQSNMADRASFFAAVSYRLGFPNALDGMGLEPKVCYRGIEGHDGIADIGSNITFAQDKVNLLALYHTSESLTLGLGVKYKSLAQINGIYTSGTAALRGNTNGNFEVNLKINLSEF